MVIFHSKLLVYQRVSIFGGHPLKITPVAPPQNTPPPTFRRLRWLFYTGGDRWRGGPLKVQKVGIVLKKLWEILGKHGNTIGRSGFFLLTEQNRGCKTWDIMG